MLYQAFSFVAKYCASNNTNSQSLLYCRKTPKDIRSKLILMPKGKRKSVQCSPAQNAASSVVKKYRGKRMSPGKVQRVRRALYSVSNKSMSLRKAACEYGLSYGFLQRRYSGETDINTMKGPATVFTEQEETSMAEWLSEMAQRGFGLRML
ncbi:uncharacterized protein LOC132753422 [Ruditapes philippinarum]|uniref:uncharacterized protein LOC132753422 n=1 Tax=Ruditapes philippinarum TaxID=129788 RepID=UPI00295B2BAF|nr:uncharacterized protein LOC132753422 [Ruditapes philippinarum]